MSQIDPGAIQGRVRQARDEAGLTQQELAELLEVHKRTVENYENVRVPDWKMLTKIARVLDRQVEWFLYGDRPDPDGLATILERLNDLGQALAALDRKLDVADIGGRLAGLEREVSRLARRGQTIEP